MAVEGAPPLSKDHLELHRMDAELESLFAQVHADLDGVDAALAATYESVAEVDTDEAAGDRGDLCEARYCLARARLCLGWSLVGADNQDRAMRDCYVAAGLAEARTARGWWRGAVLPRGFVGRARKMATLASKYKRALRAAGVCDQITSTYDPEHGSSLMTGMLEAKGVGLGKVTLLRRFRCR